MMLNFCILLMETMEEQEVVKKTQLRINHLKILCASVVFSCGVLLPQTSILNPQTITDDLTVPKFSSFSFLITYFPSELIGNSLELKSYVRSKRFRAIRERFGDLHAVNALYIRALRLTHGNTGMALLYCSLATMDHHVVGVRNPLFKAFIPLTNESIEEFTQRVENLPSHFYADSPPNGTGDRDKLQHFFGSAFIAKVFESRSAAERVGSFIEWGEDAFIVDGAYDARDMRANRQGREFGLALIDPTDMNSVLPSNFLKLWIARAEISDTSNRQQPKVSDVFQRCGVW